MVSIEEKDNGDIWITSARVHAALILRNQKDGVYHLDVGGCILSSLPQVDLCELAAGLMLAATKISEG